MSIPSCLPGLPPSPILTPQHFERTPFPDKFNLIQNSQAVKKQCGPEKGYGEKRCEIQGGGQVMAVMVG